MKIKKFLTIENAKVFVIVLFAILTLTILAFHTPFWDEAHAYNIARQFNLFELFQIEKYEGHLFIWYLLLMPFAKNNFFYPYPMYILNWLACLLFVIVLWQKSPFSFLEKFLITFSFPVFFYFAIVARCYSIGVLFLFLALSFWQKDLKNSNWISTFLALAANTNAICTIIAPCLGLILLFELLAMKKIKKFFYSFLILIAGAIIVWMQVKGAYHPAIFNYYDKFFSTIVMEFFSFKGFLQNGFIYFINKLLALSSLVLYIVSYYYMKNQKAAVSFLFLHLIFLCFFFQKFYIGNWWHYLFFFIGIIITVWLSKIYENKSKKFLTLFFKTTFLIFLSILFLKTLIFKIDYHQACYNTNIINEINIIKEWNFDNKEKYKIYYIDFLPRTSIGLLPYFKDLKIHNVFGIDKYSIEGFKENFHFLDIPNEIDIMVESFDKDKINLLFSDDNPNEIMVAKKYTLFLVPVYKSFMSNFKIYKMQAQKNNVQDYKL